MKECLNCLDAQENGFDECYECWICGDSLDAKKARQESLDNEFKRVFGE